MRPRFYILLVAISLTLIFLITRIVAFINIFFTHSGIALTQREILNAHRQSPSELRTQYVPKIIHQVYHDWSGGNGSMPSDWVGVRRTCVDLNPGWEYKLWTLGTSRDFIAKEYPWFLETYSGYKFPVQRVDTVRYFLLRHYGGIYLDLDNGCLAPLESLLYYPAWTTDGGRGALSNNILASIPSHPFWIQLTDALIPYNWDYLFPYITISYASGQWFETAIWQHYHATLPKSSPYANLNAQPLHRIMMDDRPGTEPWVFFTQMRGGSWRNWDNVMFLWIGDHLVFCALVVCALVGFTGWNVRRFVKRGVGYASISKEGDRSV